MVSKATDTATKTKISHGEPANDALASLSFKINQLRKQIQTERTISIKEKLEKNGKKLEHHVSEIMSVTSRRVKSCTEENKLSSSRIEHPICRIDGFPQGSVEKDYFDSQEVEPPTIIKLPFIEKLPPYTTWIFLDRNQRMAEDQSVVGRRRIYYDQHGSEALICSDSEEEIAEIEEEKHDFSEGEDRILWMVFQEHGLVEEVLDFMSQFIGCTSLEIQERCNILKEKYKDNHGTHSECSEEPESEKGISLEKSLSAALDSFDNLFCRRCMLFDCRLHGCSQALVFPAEKQLCWAEHAEEGKPCSDQCHLRLKVAKDCLEVSNSQSLEGNKTLGEGEKILSPSVGVEQGTCNTADVMQVERCISGEMITGSSEAIPDGALNLNISASEGLGKRNHSDAEEENPAFNVSEGSCKKQKKISHTDAITPTRENNTDLDCSGIDENKLQRSFEKVSNSNLSSLDSCKKCEEINGDGPEQVTENTKLKQSIHPTEGQVEERLSLSEWKPIEKELYMKGIEIFGRNSCLIARNLLSGLKTCVEVSSYMHAGGATMAHRSNIASTSTTEDIAKADTEYMDQDAPRRPRLLRRRGKTRKLKYSWKSAGHPSIWKRIADGKNQSCKQYTPCGCESMCGKQCPCLHNGTCCEKYCGCSKSCKNRFRGCHCAKSQCRSRQCPCFAAGRECDPDVCRNCWVSCGDGTLGDPPKRGDGQCGNMRLLLRQQQRILLAKSDVAGWGAFLKNSVNKNDYLGEYTGELISHREADKRGKIYDRANSSFLFDLNDQYVLDAYRKGDKLKFANHSSNPNCYAKVMLVAGDHRVGIFAKERIEAREELFYDYRYGPDQAPAWARKPEGSKRDDSSITQGRAKKHQSH